MNKVFTLTIDIKTTSFFLDNLSVTQILDWHIIEECFHSLTKDLDKFYKAVNGNESYFFLFEGSNWIRHDSLRNKEIFELFILKVLSYLEKKHKIQSIVFKNGNISKALKNKLSKKYDISFKQKSIKLKIQTMSRLYNFLKSFELVLTFLTIKFFSTPNKERIDNIFFVNTKKSKRLGQLEDLLDKENFQRFFYKENPKDCLKESCMLSYMKLISVFKSFYMVFKLKFFLHKSRIFKQYESLNIEILEPSFYDLLIGQFYYFSIKDVLEAHRPNCVVCSGSLNKASSRRVFKVTNDLGISSINIIEKPFPLESITMTTGVNENSIGLAQHYIVINEHHKKLLETIGLNKKISIGYKGGEETTTSYKLIEGDSIHLVLILGVNIHINYLLVTDLLSDEFILEMINSKSIVLNIKAHPMLPIEYQEKVKLFLDTISYKDVTKNKWNEIIVENRTLGVTSFSTAMSEFASYGGGVVWAPYYSFQSVIVDFMMNDIGVIASSKEKLIQTVLSCVENENYFDSLLENSRKNLKKYIPKGDLVKEFSKIYRRIAN